MLYRLQVGNAWKSRDNIFVISLFLFYNTLRYTYVLKFNSMGKIRVKTFDESGELQEDAKKKAKYEAKRAAKASEKTEEKVTDVKASDGEKKATVKQVVSSSDSKRHQSNEKSVDKNKNYPLEEAVDMLKGFKKSKFDETVELHLNVTESGINGQVSLPHGTGKKLKIRVADDALIEEVSAGKVDFDILIAKPEMMPKLAKIARVLGPRGLMPNPKNGTVTQNPDEVIEKLSAGQVGYKTESKTPVIHLSVGKVSFEKNKIEENIKTIVNSIGASKIKQAVLKSTMSPAIKFAVK